MHRRINSTRTSIQTWPLCPSSQRSCCSGLAMSFLRGPRSGQGPGEGPGKQVVQVILLGARPVLNDCILQGWQVGQGGRYGGRYGSFSPGSPGWTYSSYLTLTSGQSIPSGGYCWGLARLAGLARFGVCLGLGKRVRFGGQCSGTRVKLLQQAV